MNVSVFFSVGARLLLGIIFILLLNPAKTFSSQSISDSVESILKKSKTAGAAIAVLKNGKLLYSLNYGYADIEQNKPVLDNTTFGIMSLSKNIVACAVMQLVNEGTVNLDAPVTNYINQLPAAYNQVKIYQLLNHTSGVPDYVHVKGYIERANITQTPIELLTPVVTAPLEFTPGSKNSYSNSNYILLGLVIERVSDKKLKEYLQEMIFKPLGMKNSYLETGLVSDRNKAKGYTLQGDKLVYQAPLNPSQYWAAGGIISTKKDLITYSEALRTGKLLPSNMVKQMMQPIKLDNGAFSEYGFGFELMQTPGLEIAGNTGVGLGYNAAYLNFLRDSITVIVLTNTSNSKSALVAKKIHDIFLSNNKAEDQPRYDKLDTVVSSVCKDATKNITESSYFQDDESLQRFKQNAITYILQQAGLLNVEKEGEKINPGTIVRRYKIKFEHGDTNWVFIFSKEGKIILANHM